MGYEDPIIDVRLDVLPNEGRALYAAWDYSDPNGWVESFSWEWRYYKANNYFVGGSGTSPVETKTATFSASDTAEYVEFRVKAISKQHEVNKQQTTYFSAPWSSWYKKTLPVMPDNIKDGVVTVSTPEVQKDTDRTVFTTWSWPNLYKDAATSLTKVESYSYEWRYRIDQNGRRVWYDGTSGTAQPDVRSCTFTVPENASYAEVRVKANPLSRTVNNVEVPWFNGVWSNWVLYEIPVFVVPKAGTAYVGFGRQNGQPRSVLYTWKFSTSNTDLAKYSPSAIIDSYSYEWRYFQDNAWLDGTSGTTAERTTSCSYQIPENVSQVSVRVKPNPKQHLVNNIDVDYFEGVWSEYQVFKVPVEINPPTKVIFYTQVTIKPQSDSPNGLYATWTFSEDDFLTAWANAEDVAYKIDLATERKKNHVDEYSYEWRYHKDGIWFAGSTGTSPYYARSAEYTIPDGADVVQFRVKAKPLSRVVRGESKDWFTGVWQTTNGIEDYQKYRVPATKPTDKYGINSTPTLVLQPNSYNTLIATWSDTGTHRSHVKDYSYVQPRRNHVLTVFRTKPTGSSSESCQIQILMWLAEKTWIGLPESGANACITTFQCRLFWTSLLSMIWRFYRNRMKPTRYMLIGLFLREILM